MHNQDHAETVQGRKLETVEARVSRSGECVLAFVDDNDYSLEGPLNARITMR
jgi:hypothetical protein